MLDGPLVDATWLLRHHRDPRLCVADVRSVGDSAVNRMAYDAGHIPGAVFFDMETDLSAPTGPGRHPLPDPAVLAARLGATGIGNDAVVVAYDDTFGAAATRLWWLLRYLGHDAVAVLDGGLHAWTAAGGALSHDEPRPAQASFTPSQRPDMVMDRDEVRAVLGDALLIDVRAGERYRGEAEPLDPVAGHIPTARNAPFAENLAGDGRFRKGAELRAMYERLGVGPGAEPIVYCGSGVTACHTLLALELAGVPGGRLYAGSWSDWCSAGEGYPQAVGPGPDEE